jgi:hypothetical protein
MKLSVKYPKRKEFLSRHFATGEIMPERMVLQHQEITLSQINGVHRTSSR